MVRREEGWDVCVTHPKRKREHEHDDVRDAQVEDEHVGDALPGKMPPDSD